MNYIVMLGAYGGKGKNMGTTSVLVDESCAIDAGNILSQLGSNASKINHIFLTHSHIDHILDLPSLVDTFFAVREHSLNVYGLKETIESLKKHIFNEDIWPDFSKINLIKSGKPALAFHQIQEDKIYKIGSNKLRTFATNHTVKSLGYVIEKGENKLMFTSDTYSCPKIWEIINSDHKITTLIIEVSFVSALEELAKNSLHFTPKLLAKELENLKRSDIKIYVNHLKPEMKDRIIGELKKYENTKNCKVLEDGEVVEF